MAGADVRLSVDNDNWSCKTPANNESIIGGEVLRADVADLSGEQLRDAAGPPHLTVAEAVVSYQRATGA